MVKDELFKKKIALCNKISSNYLPNKNIKSIAISGSLAKGGADNWSDYEIAIFWETEPSIKDRTLPINSINGKIIRQITPNIPILYGVDNFNLGSFSFDIIHNLERNFFDFIKNSILNNETTDKVQEILFVTSKFIPLFGENNINLYKKLVDIYPETYKLATLRKIKFANTALLQIHASRKDIVPFRKILNSGCLNILKALCAINGIFFPGSKRTRWLTGILEIKPKNLHIKLENIYTSDYDNALEKIKNLTNETIALIEHNITLDSQILSQELNHSRRSKLNLNDLDKILKKKE